MSYYFYYTPEQFVAMREEQRERLSNYFHLHFYGIRYERSRCLPLVKGFSGNLPFKVRGARKNIYNIVRHIDAEIPSHPFFYIKLLPVDPKERQIVFNQPDFFAIAAAFSVFGGSNPYRGFNWRMNYGYGLFWRSPRPWPEDAELSLIIT